nr:ferritin-like protein [Terebratalia transversa]
MVHITRIYSMSASLPRKVLFFGSDSFALQHLIGLNRMRIERSALITDIGVVSVNFKTPVSHYAAESRLKQLPWPLSIENNQYDMGIIVSFGHLIPSKIINAFPYGIINVHPSLLPRWRGASPIIYTILNDDKITGVTVTEIKPKHFDIGPILLQEKCVVPDNCTRAQLSQHLSIMGTRMLIKALEDLSALRKCSRDQTKIGLTNAPKTNSSFAIIKWELQSQENIWRQYRAIGDMFNLRCSWNGVTVKLIDMVSLDEMRQMELTEHIQMELHHDVPIGCPFYHKKSNLLCIKCTDNWVAFRNIIIRKTMTAKAFYNGYLSKEKYKDILFKTLSRQTEVSENVTLENGHINSTSGSRIWNNH